MLDATTTAALARQLYDARKTRTPLRHFSGRHPQMTIDDGYAIQRAWVALELADGRRIDASAFGSDYDERFFGGDGLERLATWASANAASAPVVDASVRLGPCIVRPSKIVCVGLNYSDHAKESGMPIPAEPIVFTSRPISCSRVGSVAIAGSAKSSSSS